MRKYINNLSVAVFTIICGLSTQLYAGLQAKFRDLVNSTDEAKAKQNVNTHLLGIPTASFRNIQINKETAERFGLDNLSKTLLDTKGPFRRTASSFFLTNDPENIAENLLIMAGLARICGDGQIFKYNDDKCLGLMAKLFDYITPNRTTIPVTVYSMLDTVLKNADLKRSQPNPTQDFLIIYNSLDKALDIAKRK